MARAVQRVLVLSYMFPHRDAPASGPFIHEQVKALRDYQHLDVRVVSGRPHCLPVREPWTWPGRWQAFRQAEQALAWEEWDGVPVLYVPYLAGTLCQRLLYAPYRGAILKAAHRIWSTFPFDIVHAHTAQLDGFAGVAMANQYGRPLVITEHSGPFSLLTRERRSREQTLSALAAARKVWCVSESLTVEVKSYFPPEQTGHIDTLYNGVDCTLFHPPIHWNPNPNAPRLGFIGHLVGIKNPLLLIEAFAGLRQKVPGATLDMIGDGPLRQPLLDQIERLGLRSAVRLLGPRPRQEIARFLREDCDLLALSSRSETFGVVLIEALACGKPVVATRCGGPESIVTHADLGALCEPNDASSLAGGFLDATARLTTFDPARIREHAEMVFGYDRLAAALAESYRSMTQRSRRLAS